MGSRRKARLRKSSIVGGSIKGPPEVHGDKFECSDAQAQAWRRQQVHSFTNSEAPDSMPDIRYLIMAKKSVLVPALMKFRD